jgi:hypothetical protein
MIQALKVSFPCLRAVALQRAGVKTGIQIENTGFRIKSGMTKCVKVFLIQYTNLCF